MSLGTNRNSSWPLQAPYPKATAFFLTFWGDQENQPQEWQGGASRNYINLHAMLCNLLGTGLGLWKAGAQGLQLSLVTWITPLPSEPHFPPLAN